MEPTITEYFTSGGTSLNVNTVVGGSWYILSTATNALPDEDGRWLVAQVTTPGTISGVLNYQIFLLAWARTKPKCPSHSTARAHLATPK